MDATTLKFDTSLSRQLQRDITGEIYKAIRCPEVKIIREAIRSLVNSPTRRFAEVMADFDRVIKEKGLRQACVHLLKKLTDNITSINEEIIPTNGPTIVASNHPGTYDGITILSRLPREDVKIIVGANPFFPGSSCWWSRLPLHPRACGRTCRPVRQDKRRSWRDRSCIQTSRISPRACFRLRRSYRAAQQPLS